MKHFAWYTLLLLPSLVSAEDAESKNPAITESAPILEDTEIKSENIVDNTLVHSDGIPSENAVTENAVHETEPKKHKIKKHARKHRHKKSKHCHAKVSPATAQQKEVLSARSPLPESSSTPSNVNNECKTKTCGTGACASAA